MVLRSRGYRHLSLPVPLIEQIEEYIKSHKEDGFLSVPDFIKEAITERLEIKKYDFLCPHCQMLFVLEFTDYQFHIKSSTLKGDQK